MHEELWAGPGLKLGYAAFHLERMGQSLQPPEATGYTVALEASGAIVGNNWAQSFYAHFDAFLAAARSVPEIIQCCFGVDRGHSEVRDWFDWLPPAQQHRRYEFSKRFKGVRDEFRALPLSKARDISVHRTGYASVKVAVTGMFGVTYTGGPTEQVPISETRQTELPFLARPIPLRVKWQDFEIDGRPLFPECQDYLKKASEVMAKAREISTRVHGADSLTPPP
jgi:hypothetical protein